jgi:NAD+ synthase (glutamine-hydrolysing)
LRRKEEVSYGSSMRVLMAQLNPTIGDLQGNTRRIVRVLEGARARGVELVVFPELSVCGYPPEDLLLHGAFVDAAQGCLGEIVRASRGLMAVVGTVRREGSKAALFNSAAVIQDGSLAGFYDKLLLPTYDVFDERRYFEPGAGVRLWEWKGRRIGVTICEDIWEHGGFLDSVRYTTDPVMEMERLRPDMLVNLSASPYHFRKPEVRIRVCAKAAKTLQCPVFLCCQVGGNDDLVFDGYSACVNAQGELVRLGKGFVEDEVEVDTDAAAAALTLEYDPFGDLYSALVLGVRDYFRKQGFCKGCLGLSGGIDSALAACIAVDALGKENVLGMSMPSRYSSEGSRTDAAALSRNLGIEYLEIPIEAPFTAYLELLAPYFQGKPADVTEENLQARIRGALLMAVSNKLGYVVLSTGNKSELALGYCTLYGDMCGGLGVIADVTKTQVYALARWVNREREIIPASTLLKPPSAELRPNQLDTDSLPPYDVVDAVLEGYVECFLSPEEIARQRQLPLPLVLDLIRRMHAAEYKRRQAAPGIRVTRKAFRAGRRYPVVQGWC